MQTMNEPWTLGPWFWNDSANLDRLMAEDGSVILVHDRAAYAGPIDEPDARLIAAAPEMAEWLTDLLAWDDKTDQYDGVGLLPDDADGIRRLLARIRGA